MRPTNLTDTELAQLTEQLYSASCIGDFSKIKALIELGADVNLAKSDGAYSGQTPLFIASQYGHTEVIKVLIGFGADVNLAMINGYHSGQTPLFIASKYGRTEAIKALIELGADVDIFGNDKYPCYGKNPLLIASENGHAEAIKLLLAYGANPNQTSTSKKFRDLTALQLAILSKDSNKNLKKQKEIIQTLFDYGADISVLNDTFFDNYQNQLDSWGNAAKYDKGPNKGQNIPVSLEIKDFIDSLSSEESIARRDQELIKLNEAIDANITEIEQAVEQKRAQEQQLIDAINSADISEIKRLVEEEKVNVNFFNETKQNPLLVTLENKNLSEEEKQTVIQTLLSLKALLNISLYLAILADKPELIDDLLTLGANIKITYSGQDLMQIAVANNSEKSIIKLLELGFDLNKKYEDETTLLHLASEKGHVEVVRTLIKLGLDIETKDEEDSTSLCYAAHYGKIEVIEVLIELGADIENVNKDGWTPLHFASSTGEANAIELLIDKGATIDKIDNTGRTPLCYAAKSRNIKAVIALVKKGADINFHLRDFTFVGRLPEKNQSYPILGSSIFHKILSNDIENIEIIKALIKLGVDIEEPDISGDRPLHLAFEKCNIEAIEALMEAGANPNLNSTNSVSTNIAPLHIASLQGDITAIEILFDYEANYQIVTSGNLTALQLAVLSKDLSEVLELQQQVIQTLFYCGADIDCLSDEFFAKNPNQLTYFFHLHHGSIATYDEGPNQGQNIPVSSEIKEFVASLKSKESLLKRDQKLIELSKIKTENTKFIKQKKAKEQELIDAINSADIAEIKRLVEEEKVNVNFFNETKQNPLLVALENKNLSEEEKQKVIQTLLDLDALCNRSLYLAVIIDKAELIDKLLDLGANIKMNYGDQDLIQIATIKNSTKSIIKLSKLGLDVKKKYIFSAKETLISTETILHLASQINTIEATNILIKLGSNIDAVDKLFSTPLHLAIKNNHSEIIKALIQAKADIDIPNDMHQTPLHLACQEKQIDAIKLLIKAGADVSIVSKYSGTPLLLSSEIGSIEAIKLLLAYGANPNQTPTSRNLKDLTTLQIAVLNGDLSKDLAKQKQVIQTLFDYGADITVLNDEFFAKYPYQLDKYGYVAEYYEGPNEGQNIPVSLEIKQFIASLNNEQSIDKIDRNIAEIKEITAQKKAQEQALIDAINSANIAEIRRLIEQENVHVNFFNEAKQNPLLTALTSEQLSKTGKKREVIQTLLFLKALPTRSLYLAVVEDRSELIDLLLKEVEGADIKMIYGGQDLMQIAVASDSPKSINKLLELGLDINKELLDLAIKEDSAESIKTLTELGLDVNKEDLSGWTPLFLACFFNHCIGAIKALITCGANPNKIITLENLKGLTILQIAVLNENINRNLAKQKQVIQTLFDYGADITVLDDDFFAKYQYQLDSTGIIARYYNGPNEGQNIPVSLEIKKFIALLGSKESIARRDQNLISLGREKEALVKKLEEKSKRKNDKIRKLEEENERKIKELRDQHQQEIDKLQKKLEQQNTIEDEHIKQLNELKSIIEDQKNIIIQMKQNQPAPRMQPVESSCFPARSNFCEIM